jgi:hypothetical protein
MFLGDDDELVPEYIFSLMIPSRCRMDAITPCVLLRTVPFTTTKKMCATMSASLQVCGEKTMLLHKDLMKTLPKYVDTEFLVRTGKETEVSVSYSQHGSLDTSTTNITIISVGTNMN